MCYFELEITPLPLGGFPEIHQFLQREASLLGHKENNLPLSVSAQKVEINWAWRSRLNG